jgi:isohexenylglutaconyl-CoA hydratase
LSSLPECQTLLLLREGSILRVTINRPETRNALTAEVVQELTTVTDYAAADPTLRTIVLRGSDGTFCAGGDIKGFKQSFEAPAPKEGERDPFALNNRRFGDFLIKFTNLPQTVVGVIEGAAFGGGLGLVCITDIAICGADTKFALSETGLGIPPAQIAPFVVQRVPRVPGRSLAREPLPAHGAATHRAAAP